jgi:putative flippase GtrA
MKKIASQQNFNVEFARYIVVGGIAFCADVSLLTVLTGYYGIHYLVASMFSFLLGTWVNYSISVRWVFGYRALNAKADEFAIFMVIGVVTLAVSLGLMALLVDIFSLNILLAKCLVTGFTLLSNFTARRAVLFTRDRLSSRTEAQAQT